MFDKKYEIFIDYEDEVLNIVKIPSKQPVRQIDCKYGIILYKDINNNTVQISIPDFDVLFGCSIEDIESFIR